MRDKLGPWPGTRVRSIRPRALLRRIDMDPYVVFETDHRVVSHRADSRYPGYLVVASREPQPDLHRLSAEALSGLGAVLKDTEILLRSAFSPVKVVFAKLGFSGGFGCHFHAVPVGADLLAEISAHRDYANEPDGNDAMLFVSRIYCERSLHAQELNRLTATVSTLRTIVARAANSPH
jgi:diadenosine tetraphosphate (Ap4A) HIT family hydrolase